MTEAEFLAAAQANPVNREILACLPSLGLPDAWLVSGALFQTVWNLQTKRPADYGIKDYDIFYFDPDISFAAEDAVIRKAAKPQRIQKSHEIPLPISILFLPLRLRVFA